jgi:hypothetical protein
LLAERNTRLQWLLIGFCIAALPWLHYRLSTVALALVVSALLRFKAVNRWPDWLALFMSPVVSALVLFSWYVHLYGSPLPPSSDHAGFSDLAGTINGLAGTFFDQQWGAFVHNPLLALAAIALAPFAMRRGREASMLAGVVLPYLVLISAYRVWWGEWNPPARYLADIVPLAVAPLAWWLTTLSRRWRWTLLAVASIPALAVMATFVHNPQLMYNQPVGKSQLLETWSAWLGWNLTYLVPSYVSYSASSVLERAWFAGLLTTILVLLSAVAVINLLDGEEVPLSSTVRQADGTSGTG